MHVSTCIEVHVSTCIEKQSVVIYQCELGPWHVSTTYNWTECVLCFASWSPFFMCVHEWMCAWVCVACVRMCMRVCVYVYVYMRVFKKGHPHHPTNCCKRLKLEIQRYLSSLGHLYGSFARKTWQFAGLFYNRHVEKKGLSHPFHPRATCRDLLQKRPGVVVYVGLFCKRDPQKERSIHPHHPRATPATDPVWHHSFIRVTWLIYMLELTRFRVCVTCLVYLCGMTYLYVQKYSFICVIWLIYRCGMTSHMCNMTCTQMCATCHQNWPPNT